MIAAVLDESPAPVSRTARAKLIKIASRRNELAAATLETLAELGYARTSMREIAMNSEFSHGVLHYYFTDKVDLIVCGIGLYKKKCITRYDEVVTTSRSAEALADGFCLKLGETLTQEAKLHRLWYDIRAQALFDPAFRDAVKAIDADLSDMIWRVVTRYAALRGKEISVTKAAAYAVMDGLFQQHLLRFLEGDAEAIPGLIEEVRRTLPLIV